MSPLELELAISALVTLIQLFTTQLAQAEGLTKEQKQAYLDRITAAQNAIPEWR